MSQTKGRKRGMFAVPVVICLSLLVAWYLIFHNPLQSESIEKSALTTDANEGFQFVEDHDTEKNDHAELAQYVENCLTALPPEQGGGYALDNIVHEFRDDELEVVVKIPGIRTVWSRGFGGLWNHLENLSDLEELRDQFGRTTNEQLEGLASLTKLEVLVICNDVYSSKPDKNTFRGRDLPYSAVALEPLKEMKHLRQLVLCSDGLLDEGLAHVKNVPHLLSLTLTGHFSNEGLKHLNHLPEIRRLSLSGHFDDDGLVHLSKLDTLETLYLSSDRLTGRGLAHLAKLPNLRHLILRNQQPGWTFAPLKDFVVLEILNLRGMTDEMLATLPRLEKIKSLSFDGSYSLTDAGLKHLLRLPNLEELELLHTNMTPQGLKTISSCRNLRKLLLGINSAKTVQGTQEGLGYLSNLPKLEALDLRYVGLRGVDLRVLKIPTLRRLNVDYRRVQEQIAQLRKQIPQLDPVTTERIITQAEIIGEASFMRYDFLKNKMSVEIE